MKLTAKPNDPPRKHGFTLLELLVVLAILAVIATGVAGTYGRKNIDESKDKMTLHEMREIKKAFLQFEGDNCRRLKQDIVDHTGTTLPSGTFDGTFEAGHFDPAYYDAQSDRLMEFYETYGLWFLLLPRISDLPEIRLDTDDEYRFPVFEEYNALASEGWNGPYLDASIREAWNFGTLADPINFPQVADKHGGVRDADDNPLGVYRLVYYEHCENLTVPLTEPIYRRLLLVAPRGNIDWDELTSDELLLETGNLRGGDGRTDGMPEEGRLNLDTGAFTNSDESPFFVLELLNMDINLPE